MVKLISTILMELASFVLFFVALKVWKQKILRWILYGMTAYTQFVFWHLAIKYRTILFPLEIIVEVIFILLLLTIRKFKGTEEDSKEEKVWGRVLFFEVLVIVILILFGAYVYTINSIEYSDGPTVEVITEQITVPENLRELDPEFCCVHDAKEKKYDLYWVWNNGICKFASYTEDECTVYRLTDSRQDLPKLETQEEIFYRYNHNFDYYQEPTLVDTRKVKTYTLYICESSYKEDYTE